MKNIKITFISAAFLIFGLISCSDDILDTSPADAFAEDQIYADPDQAVRLVYTAYNSTESWGINKQNWWGRRFNIEGASYEGKFNFRDIDQYRLRQGWSPSNMGVLAHKWSTWFYYIRLTNEFLDNIENYGAREKDAEKTDRLIAEMRFLRANLYSKLIAFYGGVPIMEHALTINDDFQLVRNSYEECVTWIVSELDAAAVNLPSEIPGGEYGRASKAAALAVKSRTLLYAASKLHDPTSAPSNDPLYVYTIASKWQDAANAAEAVINYFGARDLIPVSDAKGYQELFLRQNIDIIFARGYGDAYYDFGTDVNSLWDQTQSPSGYGGWALSSPSHNFAMEFKMADGSYTNGGTYDAAKPNDNRELRYYANLNYQGAVFRGRPVDYALADNPSEATPDGLDSPRGLGNTLHSSKTGYNIRKFQDESIGLTDLSPNRPYVLYRLAEMYLNYAEAQYHLGNEGPALEALNKVASRAHLPEITASGEALLEAIRNERRIELAFEGHNFHDERRWMNESHLGFDVKSVTWTKASDGTLNMVEGVVVTRPWFEREYYLPIPQDEVQKAPSILQNYLYE